MLNWIRKDSSCEERPVSPSKSRRKKFSFSSYGIRQITMSFSSRARLNESIDSAIGEEEKKKKEKKKGKKDDIENIPVKLRSSLKKPKSGNNADDKEGGEKRVSFVEIVEETKTSNDENKCKKKVQRIFSFVRDTSTTWRASKLSDERAKRKLETSRDSGCESMSSLSSSSSSLISNENDNDDHDDVKSMVVRSSSPLTEIISSSRESANEEVYSSDVKKYQPRQRQELSENASTRTTMMKYVYEKSRVWAETFKGIIPSRRRRTTSTSTSTTTEERKKKRGGIVSLDRLRSKGRKVSFSKDTKIYDCNARLLDDQAETKDPNLDYDEIYENSAIDESTENPFDVTTESSIGTILFGTSLQHHRSLDDLYKLLQENRDRTTNPTSINSSTSNSDSRLYVREGTAKLLSECNPAIAIKTRILSVNSASESEKDNERDEGLPSSSSSSTSSTSSNSSSSSPSSSSSAENALLSSRNFDNFLASKDDEKHQRICSSDSELFLEKTKSSKLGTNANTKQKTSSSPNVPYVESTQPVHQLKRGKSFRYGKRPISKSADELTNDREEVEDYDDVAEFNSLQNLCHVPDSMEKLDTVTELSVERQPLSRLVEADVRKEDDDDDEDSIIRESTRKRRRHAENFEELEVFVPLLNEEAKETEIENDKGVSDRHESSYIVTMYV